MMPLCPYGADWGKKGSSFFRDKPKNSLVRNKSAIGKEARKVPHLRSSDNPRQNHAEGFVFASKSGLFLPSFPCLSGFVEARAIGGSLS